VKSWKVLGWTREALDASAQFVAGAYIEGQDGEIVSLYRKQMDAIVAKGGIPILFQTKRLHGKNFSREGVSVSRGESRVFACAGI